MVDEEPLRRVLPCHILATTQWTTPYSDEFKIWLHRAPYSSPLVFLLCKVYAPQILTGSSSSCLQNYWACQSSVHGKYPNLEVCTPMQFVVSCTVDPFVLPAGTSSEERVRTSFYIFFQSVVITFSSSMKTTQDSGPSFKGRQCLPSLGLENLNLLWDLRRLNWRRHSTILSKYPFHRRVGSFPNFLQPLFAYFSEKRRHRRIPHALDQLTWCYQSSKESRCSIHIEHFCSTETPCSSPLLSTCPFNSLPAPISLESKALPSTLHHYLYSAVSFLLPSIMVFTANNPVRESQPLSFNWCGLPILSNASTLALSRTRRDQKFLMT